MNRTLRSILVAMLTLTPALAFAGGAMIYEVGSPDVGLASAGYAARAQDAATVLTNPAGMSELKGGGLLLGLQGAYGTLEFSPYSQTTTSGSDDGNAVGFLPVASFFYVHHTAGKLAYGIGTFSNFGASVDYGDDWVGRYYVQKATMLGLSFMPAISYQVCDTFSIGLALNAMYGYLDQTVAINNIDPRIGDGQLEITDGTWGFGGNLGLLWEPHEETRFGLTYSSKVKLDFSDVPEFTDLGPGLSAILSRAGIFDSPLELGMNVPQMVMFSFYRKTSDRWAVMGNAGWQDWSQFGRVSIAIDSANPKSLTTALDYEDTWQGAVGAQYQTKGPWLLSFGVAYDTPAVDADSRNPLFPVGGQWRFGAGGQIPLKKNLQLGIAYEIDWSGSLSMDQERGPLAGRIFGNYYNTSVQFLAANLSWRY